VNSPVLSRVPFSLVNSQALSADDIDRLRRRVNELTGLQTAANDAWKAVRWLPDLTCYARDRANLAFISNVGSSAPPISSHHQQQLQQLQQQLGSPSSPTVKGLPLNALFGPNLPVQDVSGRRRHHPTTSSSTTAAESSRQRPVASTTESGTAADAGMHHGQGYSDNVVAATTASTKAVSSSVIGSDSDYHSDISSFSAELVQSVTAAGKGSVVTAPVSCQYQPVLL